MILCQLIQAPLVLPSGEGSLLLANAGQPVEELASLPLVEAQLPWSGTVPGAILSTLLLFYFYLTHSCIF